MPDRSVYSTRSGIGTSDIAVFAALGWERRLVTRALADLTPIAAGRWRGTMRDGTGCTVIQCGVGFVRASAHAAAAPAANHFVSCGCAGALVPWLRAGDLVIASGVLGDDGVRFPAESDALAAWAARSGLRVHIGPLVSAGDVLATETAKRAAGTAGALAVDMESSAVAAEASARRVPFTAVRVILDEAADDLEWTAETIDPATGELRLAAALRVLAVRPRLWPQALRLGRCRRLAASRLGAFVDALLRAGGEAFRPEVEPATAASR